VSFREDIYLQRRVLLLGVLLMLIKGYGFYITKSNAILSDALESIVNILAGGFALYSLHLASKPKDLNHPNGHGKIEFVSGSVEGLLIIAAGLIMVAKSIYNLLYPNTLDNLDIGIILTVVAGGVNYLMGIQLQKRGELKDSQILISGGKHLKTDGYSSAALVLGLTVLFWTDTAWLDNLIALLFGVFIAYTGISVVRKNMSGIMDETQFDEVKKIIDTLQSHRKTDWIDIHNFRMVKYGRDLHVDAHVTLPYYWDLSASHQELENISRVISENSSTQVEVFFHADPCSASSCSLCQISCQHRSNEFVNTLTWTLDNVLPNHKHKL